MFKWRSFRRCSHDITVTTVTAGLAREVCESCGQVRLRYVERSVQIFPTPPRQVVPLPSREREPGSEGSGRWCALCTRQAVFLIPDQRVCEEHAWQAASRIDWDRTEIWVPIRIDTSNAGSL